ncbi:hypothetical protein PQX77_021285 [Marasmius sp. AFHP31]|nr:hypothetical protein PQX77_021282 [Marasmius sp. AFHP31]KAK1216107.1 hypothetical protein PQX77_021285 [Marasmius sp. AFHP31]
MFAPSKRILIPTILSIAFLIAPTTAAPLPESQEAAVDNANSGWVILDPCNSGWTVSRQQSDSGDRRRDNAVDFCNNGWHVTGRTVSKTRPTAAVVV